METLRQTIKRITKNHLELGNSMFGQCLSAVGWVGDTIDPSSPNLVELPMADVAGGGFVVGASLFSRPIYVVRYQGFQWYNSISVCNYAARAKDMWGTPCPIFIRSIAMEGGIGPVAGSSHHGIFYRQPGVKIVSPMTPKEYESIYASFMSDDDPYYISEHRGAYGVREETPDINYSNPDWSLFPLSITRFNSFIASEELKAKKLRINVYPQVWIKPNKITDAQIKALSSSTYGGIVLDDDYESGVASSIAHELMLASGKPVYLLCLENKTAGFTPKNDNLPPQVENIKEFILKKS